MGLTLTIASETRLFNAILKQPAQLNAPLSSTLNGGGPALERAAEILRRPNAVVISGIGASWHAGMAIHASLLEYGIPSDLRLPRRNIEETIRWNWRRIWRERESGISTWRQVRR